MIDQIEQGLQDLKQIEADWEAMRTKINNLRFDNHRLTKENEDLRRLLATSVETIQRLKAEEGESPNV